MQVSAWPRGINRTVRSGPLGIAFDGSSASTVRPVHSSQLGRLLSVKFSTRYEQGFGGHDLAEWTIDPHAGFIGGLFRPGDHVEIRDGGSTPWIGEFSESVPNDDGTVTFRAKGYAHNLADYDSIFWGPVSGSPDIYYPTNRLSVSSPPAKPAGDANHYGWDYAVHILGMPIAQVVGSFPTTSWGSTAVAQKPVKVGTVLTALLLENDARWAVWGRALVIAADPTTASLTFDSPQGLLGVATDEYATHIGVWYVSAAPAYSAWASGTTYTAGALVSHAATEKNWQSQKSGNTNNTPAAGSTWWTEYTTPSGPSDWSMAWASDGVGISRFDVRTEVVDYRGAGLMTSVRAGAIAQSLLDQVRGKFVLTGSFTLTRDAGARFVNGGPAMLSGVRAGLGMNLTNVRTSQSNLLPDGDFAVIGKTEYEYIAPTELGGEPAERVTITPMGAVPRDMSSVLQGVPLDSGEQLGGAA